VSSSSSSLRRDQVREEGPGAGGGGAGGAVVIPVPEVGAPVASGAGTSGSEASDEAICSVIAHM
jgi:GTPase involved in cell partitioning and DNA repair